MPHARHTLVDLPSPYYRVASRAIVLDKEDRILVLQNDRGEAELPGGGWEFDEDFETGLDRELHEEIGVGLGQLGPYVGMYRGRGSRGMMYLRIAFRAELTSHDFSFTEGNNGWFATREEFQKLDFTGSGEEGVKELADQIWAV